jgi:hypothetical protein
MRIACLKKRFIEPAENVCGCRKGSSSMDEILLLEPVLFIFLNRREKNSNIFTLPRLYAGM